MTKAQAVSITKAWTMIYRSVLEEMRAQTGRKNVELKAADVATQIVTAAQIEAKSQ
jgi:hypothetical protein